MSETMTFGFSQVAWQLKCVLMPMPKRRKIKELNDFIARFSANASKSKQATSRKKQLEKITLDDIKPSSRKYPFVKFESQRDLGNDLLRVENVSKTIDGVKILDNINFTIRPGEKAAILSRSDLAQTTMMQILAGTPARYRDGQVWSDRDYEFASS